jgi:hypothetical protein
VNREIEGPIEGLIDGSDDAPPPAASALIPAQSLVRR